MARLFEGFASKRGKLGFNAILARKKPNLIAVFHVKHEN